MLPLCQVVSELRGTKAMSEIKVKLPLLKQILNNVTHHSKINLKNVVFVCVQHLLETNVELFSALIKLGADPYNIFLLGKRYSQSLFAIQKFMKLGIHLHNKNLPFSMSHFCDAFQEEIKDLWNTVEISLKGKKEVDTIVILDDGGYCLTAIPPHISEKYKLIGVEQTTAGIHRPGIAFIKNPIIQVASSAAKRVLESPIIASAVAKKIEYYLPMISKQAKCGVIGCGAIGSAVMNKLKTLGYTTFGFDSSLNKKNTSAGMSNSVVELIQNSDIIIGCSGNDTLENETIESLINGNKIFISCSSEDKEFLSLLRRISKKTDNSNYFEPLRDIIYYTSKGHEVRVLRGGFPINFDNSREVESPNDIQLTRALILCGILQGVVYLNSNKTKNFARYMLQPEIQKYIALTWRKVHPMPMNYARINKFEDAKWILNHSTGENLKLDLISDIFHYKEDHKVKVLKGMH